MTWFKIYKEVYNSQTSQFDYTQINIPLKRIINISNLPASIQQNEQVYVNLNSIQINSYINSSLEKATDNYSYIVVYEDYSDEEFFVPVQSTIVDNVLYFKAVEEIEKETIQERYYAIYYGSSNLKYIETAVDNDNNNIFIRPDDLVNPNYDITNFEEYTLSVDSSSSNYSLAYYNAGTDWVDGISKKIGAKAYGIFDGPKIRIFGSKGKQYGKFKINFYPYTNQIISSTKQEFTVDCYSTVELLDQILFEKQNLEYQKYIFEIEVISDKNDMATSNDVHIKKYMFNPDYGLKYEAEKINPSLSFITIAGVR